MGERFVGRGALLQGINKAARDSRIPYTLARKIENFSLPDGRAKRRTGYKELNSTRVVSQSVTKSTGSTVETRYEPSANSRQSHYKTPLSYGLVRDGQVTRPSTTSDWSLEFYAVLGDQEALVVEPFERRAKGPPNGASTYNYDIALRTAGVYLFDWSLLSNQHEFDSTGTIAAPGTIIDISEDVSAASVDKAFDAFPLTTLAISFTKTALQVEMGMVAKATHANPGRYWPREINLSYSFPGGEYTPGTGYHIALTYTSSTGVLRFYVDGTERATYTVANTTDYGFIGEYDKLNNATYASGLQRDIVLLNEFTVRGSYASACRIQDDMHGHQTFFHDYSNDPTDPSMPWCCSPPRGTKMRDLRFWSDVRSQSEIDTNKTTSLDGTQAGLVANWLMSDGVSILYDNLNNYEMSLHHSYPPYIVHNDLLHNLGIRVADGQHIRLECKEGDEFFIKDVAGKIKSTFGWDPYTSGGVSKIHRKIQDRHNFTAQIQVTTPRKFQEELNKVITTAPYQIQTMPSAPTPAQESRQSMKGGVTSVAGNKEMDLYALRTGEQTQAAGTQLANYTGDNSKNYEFNRAYDSTLFSVEGSTERHASNNHGDYIKQVLARGSLTPDGKIAFECYLSCEDTAESIVKDRLIRIVSTTTLAVNTTYVLSFVKRATYTAGTRYPTGVALEIWIGTGATAPTAADVTHERVIVVDEPASGFVVGTTTTVNTTNAIPSYIQAGETFSVLLKNITGTGAGLVNGYHIATHTGANSFTIPVNTTATTLIVSATFDDITYEPILRSSPARHGLNHDIVIGCSEVNSGWDRSITCPSEITFGSGGGNHGPYFVPKQYNSPYQQQPGFFTLGYFRLWSQALAKGEIQDSHAVTITSQEYSPDLLINLEVEDISGNRIPNKSRYPVNMELGYIAWGAPQSWEDQQFQSFIRLRSQMREAAVTGGFSMEDCLGYTALKDPYTASIEGGLPTCLAPYQTTLTHAFGLLFGWRDHISLDKSLDGSFEDLHIQAHGILNDFAAAAIWRGVSVGDRTILTADGGIPKVFNGKSMTPAGLKSYSGGRPLVGIEDIQSGPGLADNFYGIKIAYRSEEYNLQVFSDTAVVQVTSGPKSLEVYDISPHPDPRITSIVIYRTRGQATAALARVAPLFPISDDIFPNANVPVVVIEDDDDSLFPVPLDLRQDPFPVCRYGAIANGRLYLTGDSIIPDAVYYSDINNPEKFDLIRQRILLRDTGGDRVNGIVSLFGSIFIFKSNSIWRVDEHSGGLHQRVKVADIGAVSEDGIQVITIPDTGRTVVFIWSQHGPYLFDGSTTQYVGYQLETFETPTVLAETLQVADPSTVVILHDLENKEVLCSFVSAGGTSRKLAAVYNYRFNSWYFYYGLNCDLALSQAFSGNSLATVSASNPTIGSVDLTHEFYALMAGPSGRVYRWGEDDLDGFPTADTSANPYTISAFSAPGGGIYEVTITGTFTADYVGLYLTLVDVSDNDLTFFSSRIVSRVGNVFTIVANAQSGEIFIPVNGDKAYICQAPAFIEFPWDSLEAEFVEKHVEDLITWHKQDFKFAAYKDWEGTALANRIAAGTLATGDNSRKEYNIAKSVESLKLKVFSYDLNSMFDAFDYRVMYNEDGITE